MRRIDSEFVRLAFYASFIYHHGRFNPYYTLHTYKLFLPIPMSPSFFSPSPSSSSPLSYHSDQNHQRLASWRLKDHEDERTHSLFPDEIDTPLPPTLARTRFARYRGLRSFRTSPWDEYEALPREYGRVFAFGGGGKGMSLRCVVSYCGYGVLICVFRMV